MRRRIGIITVTAAMALAIGALPAMAQTGETPERDLDRGFPPAWVDATEDEVRSFLEGRLDRLESRITDTDKLTDEQKAEALGRVDDTRSELGQADDNAELVGIAGSRAQLLRFEFRSEVRGADIDVERHVEGDLERAEVRIEHVNTVIGWAATAGVDVTAAEAAIAQAEAQLEVAAGEGALEERHDAVHIARAWTVQAWTELMT